MNAEQFEPVYLEPEGPGRLTEYGKRYFDERYEMVDKYWHALKDIAKLAKLEATKWAEIETALAEAGVPTALTGLSQYAMGKIGDHADGKLSWTMPTTIALAGGTSAPTTATTGVWGTAETTNYTGYARVTVAGAGFNSATVATPSVVTNNGAITWPACTASTATWLGVLVTDNATTNTGNAIWTISISSVVISTTATPPTIATTAMSLQITGS